MKVSAGDVAEEAARRLVEVARPTKVILFGSAARSDTDEESDLDFLVVLKEVTARRAEMVRLLNALRDLRVPVDVLVYSEEEIHEWGHLPGSVLYEALTEGKVLYEA